MPIDAYYAIQCSAPSSKSHRISIYSCAARVHIMQFEKRRIHQANEYPEESILQTQVVPRDDLLMRPFYPDFHRPLFSVKSPLYFNGLASHAYHNVKLAYAHNCQLAITYNRRLLFLLSLRVRSAQSRTSKWRRVFPEISSLYGSRYGGGRFAN